MAFIVYGYFIETVCPNRCLDEMTGRSLIIAIIWGPPPVRPNLGRMSRALRVFPCHN